LLKLKRKQLQLRNGNVYAEIPTSNTSYIDAIFKAIADHLIFPEHDDHDFVARGLTYEKNSIPTKIFLPMNCSSLST
jgi:hypothetical protein